MSKAILRIDAHIVSEWFVAGKTREEHKSPAQIAGTYRGQRRGNERRWSTHRYYRVCP